MTALREKIHTYVREYYDKPQKLKTTNRSYAELLRNALSGMVIKAIYVVGLEKMKKKMVHVPSGDKPTTCLKGKHIEQTPIGEGYFGKIYKIGNKKAAKIVPLTKHGYKDFVRRVETDMEISKMAGDLGVGPKIFDAYTCCLDEEGNCFYVMEMELLKGMPLRQWLQKKKAPALVSKAKNMVRKKLAILLRHSISHNDLHDLNVFVVGTHSSIKDVFILDYGEASFRGKEQPLEMYIDILFRNDNRKNTLVQDDVLEYTIGRLLDNRDVILTP